MMEGRGGGNTTNNVCKLLVLLDTVIPLCCCGEAVTLIYKKGSDRAGQSFWLTVGGSRQESSL